MAIAAVVILFVFLISIFIIFPLFFFIHWKILMKIFNFSTSHKCSYKALSVLLIYSALLGYLSYTLTNNWGFLLFLIFNIILLVKKYRKYKKQDLMEVAGEEHKNLTSEEKSKETLGKPTKSTLKYFVINSAIYLVVFSASFSATYLFFFIKS